MVLPYEREHFRGCGFTFLLHVFGAEQFDPPLMGKYMVCIGKKMIGVRAQRIGMPRCIPVDADDPGRNAQFFRKQEQLPRTAARQREYFVVPVQIVQRQADGE